MDAQDLLGSTADQITCLAFDLSGHLPSGVHDLSIEELANVVCFNKDRKRMWVQLTSFLVWPVLSRRFSHAYIGGGFLSQKSDPNDIDVVLETCAPYGAEAFSAVSRFFAVGLDQVQLIYGVHLHFWMQDAPSGLSDYRTFFQYEKPKELSNLHNTARGIVRIDLLHPDMPTDLRRHLRGEGLT
jgi:hypothetical protein